MNAHQPHKVARSGHKVVTDLMRFLATGDSGHITRGLYEELYQHCGFMAHYDIHGFRHSFHGHPERLVEGELYRLDQVPDTTYPWLYTDGQTSNDVLGAFRVAAAQHLSASASL